LNVALSDTSGTIDSSVTEDLSPGHGTASISKDGDSQVHTVRGDQLINEGEIPQPNVVKIDVEGAEWLVINGLKTALANEKCRVVYCEVHFPTDYSSRGSIYDHNIEMTDIISQLEQCGYKVEKMEAE
jgi:FkbM family methyltransferase